MKQLEEKICLLDTVWGCGYTVVTMKTTRKTLLQSQTKSFVKSREVFLTADKLLKFPFSSTSVVCILLKRATVTGMKH